MASRDLAGGVVVVMGGLRLPVLAATGDTMDGAAQRRLRVIGASPGGEQRPGSHGFADAGLRDRPGAGHGAGGREASSARQPPRAVVIDLDRAPARGRDIAIALRQRVSTRRIPIVFVARDRDGVHAARWLCRLETMHAGPGDVVTAVASALAMPPSGTAPPPRGHRRLLRHAATASKLGIKPGMRVVLVEGLRMASPSCSTRCRPDVALRTTNRGARDVTVWFTRSRRELERGMTRMAQAAVEDGRLWICLAEEDLARWPPITPGTTCGASGSRPGWSTSRSAPSTRIGPAWRSCDAGAELTPAVPHRVGK